MSKKNRLEASLATVAVLAKITELDEQIKCLLERRAKLAERAQYLIMGGDPDKIEI
jgi:chorismate mutase